MFKLNKGVKKLVRYVFHFWFEIFDQTLALIDNYVIFILPGNNEIKCQKEAERRATVFDKKLVMKHDYKWFLHFMLKCWNDVLEFFPKRE